MGLVQDPDGDPSPAARPDGLYEAGAMSRIAKAALKALGRRRKVNALYEVEGCGPAWACGRYATHGHDYNDCPDCWSNFRRRLGIKETV